MMRLHRKRTALVLAGVLAFLSIVLPGAGFSQAREVKIGFHAPLTGPLADVGKECQQGALLAVERVRQAYGVAIMLVAYDDRATPTEAVTIARRLMGSDRVLASISGSVSGATRATARVYQDGGTPYIAAYAVHPEIAATGRFVIANSINGDVQGKAGAQIVARYLKAKRISMLVVDNDFGRSVAAAFKTEAQRLGGVIVSEDVYPFGERDFRTILNRIAGQNPDLIYTTGFPADAAQTVRQTRELGLRANLMGTEAIDHPETLFPLAGDLAEGLIVTTALNRGDKRKVVQDFLAEFQRRHNRPADMVVASCFDAVQTVGLAFSRGGTTADRLIERILALRDWDEALTGPFYRYNDQGQVIKPVYGQIVRNQSFQHLVAITEVDIITPPGK